MGASNTPPAEGVPSLRGWRRNGNEDGGRSLLPVGNPFRSGVKREAVVFQLLKRRVDVIRRVAGALRRASQRSPCGAERGPARSPSSCLCPQYRELLLGLNRAALTFQLRRLGRQFLPQLLRRSSGARCQPAPRPRSFAFAQTPPAWVASARRNSSATCSRRAFSACASPRSLRSVQTPPPGSPAPAATPLPPVPGARFRPAPRPRACVRESSAAWVPAPAAVLCHLFPARVFGLRLGQGALPFGQTPVPGSPASAAALYRSLIPIALPPEAWRIVTNCGS